MRILIAGAGYVGNALASILLEAGDQVVTLNRVHAGAAGAEHVHADLTVPASLSALHGDFDAIAYTVGPDETSDAGYERAYVSGLRNLLASGPVAGSAGGAPRVVLTTSTAVYGQASGEWVDETSETTPRDFRGQRLLQAEHMLSDWSPNTTSVRLGGIYGPGRQRVVTAVMAGSTTLAAGGPFINRLHRDDCAGLVAHVLKMAEPPPVLIGTDDEPATSTTVKAFVAERLHVRLSVDTSQKDAGTHDLGKRCRNTKLHDIGYALRYPTFRDGYGALME